MGNFKQKPRITGQTFVFLSGQRIVFILGCALFTLYITYLYSCTDFFPVIYIRQSYYKFANQIGFVGSTAEDDAKMTCKLPKLIPFDPSVAAYVKGPPKIVCQSPKYPQLFKAGNDSNLLVTTCPFQFGLADCCYKNVSRVKNDRVRYSNTCIPLTNVSTKIPAEYDVIALYCRNTSDLTKDRAAIDVIGFQRLNLEAEKRIETLSPDELNPDNFSVILFGMDSTSHMNFLRVMPKTHKFLTEDLSGVGMNGFVSVGGETFPNVVAALTGLNETELKHACWPNRNQHFDCCPFIWKDFAKQGFRTYHAEDVPPFMTAFTYAKRGFASPPTDYYPQHFLQAIYGQIGHTQPHIVKVCAGSRLGIERILDEMKEFAVLMGPRKYFQYIWCNSISHDDQITTKLADEPFYTTLKTMNSEGYLENKILIFFSDHGLRWGGFRKTYQGQIEVRMPYLYIMIPKAFQDKYPSALRNLRSNANRLTSAFDIYGTLAQILRSGRPVATEDEKQYKWIQETQDNLFRTRSRSLFEPIPLNRTCQDAGIRIHHCVCHKPTLIATNGTLIKEAGEIFVKKLNEKLVGFPKCAVLKLWNISEAANLDLKSDKFETINGIKKNGTVALVRLVLETVPGNARFEATMSRSSESVWQVSSDSRINMYKSQSDCVADAKLKNCCYCLQQ